MSNHLNDKYKDLDLIANNYSENYINANPFPHVIFDNFFNENLLNKIINEYPSNLDKIGYYANHPAEQKYALYDSNKFSNNTTGTGTR